MDLEGGSCSLVSFRSFGKGKDRYFLVSLGLALFLLDDVVDQLRGGSIKPDLAALGADLGRDFLKAVKLLTPWLVWVMVFFCRVPPQTAHLVLRGIISPSYASTDQPRYLDHTSGRNYVCESPIEGAGYVEGFSLHAGHE